MIFLILADLIWIILVAANRDDKKSINIIYWKNLSQLNNFCLFLGIFEIIIKCFILSLIFLEYKKYFPYNFLYLINFDYINHELGN